MLLICLELIKIIFMDLNSIHFRAYVTTNIGVAPHFVCGVELSSVALKWLNTLIVSSHIASLHTPSLALRVGYSDLLTGENLPTLCGLHGTDFSYRSDLNKAWWILQDVP